MIDAAEFFREMDEMDDMRLNSLLALESFLSFFSGFSSLLSMLCADMLQAGDIVGACCRTSGCCTLCFAARLCSGQGAGLQLVPAQLGTLMARHVWLVNASPALAPRLDLSGARLRRRIAGR